ncbi:MAG TPA: hypothetical protein VKB31_05950 [Trueperaceae bacterium]|nr:hypothetical protein [Trueperaceae bacterium]
MRDIKPSDALRALRNEFGFRLDEPRARGRERMVAAVRSRLGVSREVAEDAVYALEHAEVVRFVRDEAGDAGAPMPQGLPRGAAAPAPVISRSPLGDPVSPGHWRIGEPG